MEDNLVNKNEENVKVEKNNNNNNKNNSNSSVKKSFLKKNIKFILFIIFLMLVILINYILKFKGSEINLDLSKNKIYTLSQENIEKIKTVNEEIEIYYPGERHKKYIDNLINSIVKNNKNIKYKDSLPEDKEDFQFSTEYIYIIKEGTDNIFSISPDIEGIYEAKKKSEIKYLLENKVVNGILNINSKTKEEKSKIGIGVPSEKYPLGEYNNLIQRIFLKGEKVEGVLLDKEIPDHIKILILPGIFEDISEKALENLLNFGKRGGSFYVSNSKINIFGHKEKDKKLVNFNKFLEEYGVEAENKCILQKQDTKTTLEESGLNVKYKNNPDLGKIYVIKADPEFESNTFLKTLKDNDEKNIIFVASPIKILDNLNEKNVKINTLMKSLDGSIAVPDLKEYYDEMEYKSKLMFAKEILDKTKETDLEKIRKEKGEELYKAMLEIKNNKDLDLKAPEYTQTQFILGVEIDKKFKDEKDNKETLSKMVYISTDETLYGSTSLNHENQTPPPLLNVYNQRLVYDILEYLEYGNLDFKVAEGSSKYIKEITKDEKDKYELYAYICAGVVFVFICGVKIYFKPRERQNDETI